MLRNGLMGYRTPNIDRIAPKGMMFTDYYAEQSCTAGRAAFITGQNPYPHRPDQGGPARRRVGLQEEDPTIAELLKPHGLRDRPVRQEPPGDRDEFLPTVHGFDEFFGNLYHLNAEEEPELPDYPKDPEVPQEVRAARRAAHAGPTATAASASRTPARSPRSGWRRSTTRFRDAAIGIHQAPAQGRQAVLRVVQHHAHALPHPHQAREPGPGRALAVANTTTP